MKLYKYGKDGFYSGEVEACIDRAASKRIGSIAYVKHACTTSVKPKLIEGFKPRFNGSEWEYVKIETVEPAEDSRKEIIDEDELSILRRRREKECFTIINRGVLWYARMTDEQMSELREWYQEWLDVTETKVVPERPDFID